MRRRLAPIVLAIVLLGLVGLPAAVLLALPAAWHEPLWHVVSLVAAVAASGLLLLTFVLPSRIRLITSSLGVERLLLRHRMIAVAAMLLALGHVLVVLVRPDGGLGVLDLRVAPPRVWAGSAATLGLVLLILLGLTRRRRRPRYEGWRLVHVVLANTVLFGVLLHVWWLRHLTEYRVGLIWFSCFAAGVAGVTGYRWIWRPLRSRRRRYVVDEVREESPTAVTVVLHAVGHHGTEFQPGQFAWLKIGSSPFVFEEHPFTIASAATEPWRKEFTIKALGDFTEVLAGLRPGRPVHLDGPHGSFTLQGSRAVGFVMVAGGVGITPMLSMLRTLADRGDPRPVLLVVAGRTADDLLHRADHENLDSRLDLRVVEILEEPPEAWDGEVGRLTEAVLGANLPGRRSRSRMEYFICGPAPMVVATTRILRAWGVPPARIRSELFDVV